MKEWGKKLLAGLLIVIIIYSISLVYWVYTYSSNSEYTQATGKAQSVVSFCVNNPPVVNLSTCSENATQGVFYSCRFNISDLNNNNVTLTTTFTYMSKTFSNSTAQPFNISSSGNFSFTPNNNDVGSYKIKLDLDDNQNCFSSLSNAVFNLTVINANDPPILIQNISDIEYNQNEVVHAFSLINYFTDPDGDFLTYTVSGNSAISIVILPTSEVVISSTTCGLGETVIFTAIDPYNATNYSNAVTINCKQTVPAASGSSNTGASGGGSSGGSSLLCRPDFNCFDYHMCNTTNQKIQRCVDKKGCKDEALITVPCLYNPRTDCNETWTCSDWDLCLPNGTRSRICTDEKLCGTNYTMPNLTESCEYIGTCNDGIKNCHDNFCEEEVDCGGACGACKTVQVPYPFKEEKGYGIYIITGIVLILLMAILLYHYFKKQIDEMLAKAGWFFNKNKRKQFLITLPQRNQIIDSLEKCEKMIASKAPISDIANLYESQIKFYISSALKINPDFERKDVENILSKNRIVKVVSKIIMSMYNDYQIMIQTQSKINPTNIKRMIEELRTIAIHTAPKALYSKEVQELKTDATYTPVQKIETHLVNAYIALEFLELEAAKKKYMEILNEYAKVTIKDEVEVYEDVKRLYDNITYVNGWAGLEG